MSAEDPRASCPRRTDALCVEIGTCATRGRLEVNAARVLGHMGYRLIAVEIDADTGRARIEVRRHDGYTLTLDVRHGVGAITREMLRRETVAVGRRGDRFRADRLSIQFLGRTRVIGGTQAVLRAFADTIGANATLASRLSARDVIGMFGSPEHLADAARAANSAETGT